MAKSVAVEFPEMPLSKVDLVLKVKEGGEVFGDLKVSKGGIEWRARGKRHAGPNTVVLSWAKFAKMMEQVK